MAAKKLAARKNDSTSNLAGLMGMLPKSLKQAILSMSLEEVHRGQNASSNVEREEKTKAIAKAMSQVQKEKEPPKKAPLSQPKKKMTKKEQLEEKLEDRPYVTKKDDAEYYARWQPPRPLPPPPEPRSLPEGQDFHQNSTHLGLLSAGHRKLLVFKSYPVEALENVSTVYNRSYYGPNHMGLRRWCKKTIFTGCSPHGLKMVLNYIRNIHFMTLSGPDPEKWGRPGPNSLPDKQPVRGTVIREPMNLENRFNALLCYQVGVTMGIDNYLADLRQRLCEKISDSIYKVDGKNTIQSPEFIRIALKIAIKANSTLCIQDHTNDPVWKCVLENAAQLRQQGGFRDQCLRCERKEFYPWLHDALDLFDKGHGQGDKEGDEDGEGEGEGAEGRDDAWVDRGRGGGECAGDSASGVAESDSGGG
ncbi:hypothetical protein BU23DRAFT_563410 [Bimuria novae-zelandiae CBS 107.79]|uniref:Uncharacterized protein n=1 Tax=Bimuria novae-zelandiae CBS 107.79 TaxID=1447943 RepID=A0A6A5VWC3_9PLEO|nr:hypothetical protein BU23DRAFT_563410 [Bimuria novae-zelandiae CBS 107.79]